MKHDPIIAIQDGAIVDSLGKKKNLRGAILPPPGEKEGLPSLLELEEIILRLKKAGISMIRWQICWASVELEPNNYNEVYLADLRTLLKMAEDAGLLVFLEPLMQHWGSSLGGHGAPAWTVELAGLDGNLDESQKRQMMFTLFWAGKRMAPEILVEGDNIQDYLQEHYVSSMKHVARRVKDCKTVVGFGIMAEGSPGDAKALEMFPLDFEEDCLKPFQKKFIGAFQKKHSHYLFLAEAMTTGQFSQWKFHPSYSDQEARTIQREGGVIPDADSEATKVVTVVGCPTPKKNLLGLFGKDKAGQQFQEAIKKASGGGNAVMAEATSTQGLGYILESVQEAGLSYFVSMAMVEASPRT